ncbi:MAG: glycerate kinase [Lactobacillus sp.]|nr:glycerate kinase [Lactobacillus sp.]
MKIVIAPDSFKSCLTASEFCQVAKNAILSVNDQIDVVTVPMADGGEGTTEAIASSTNSRYVSAKVHDAFMHEITAKYAFLEDEKTAVIEMSSASGIQLVNQLDPYHATSYGTGELIKDAISIGAKKIILGLGGSATNDAGSGMLMALGFKFLKADGESIQLGAIGLKDLAMIEPIELPVEIEIASDVKNPLLGKTGASYVFGKQKGAQDSDLSILDTYLANFVKVSRKENFATTPGAGAAGGLGFALLAYCQATIRPGIELVIDYTHLADKLLGADYCITGEGAIDFQTKFGKTPYGVAKLAKQVAHCKVIALTGKIGDGIEQLTDIDAIFALSPQPQSLEMAMENAKNDLRLTVKNLIKLLEP